MSRPKRTSLIAQVVRDQQELVGLWGRSAGPSWLELELTMAQMKAAMMLSMSGPVPIGKLGAMLGMGRPAATLLVDALVRLGLVVRSEDPDDRRRTLVQLSPNGETLTYELRQGRKEQFAAWIAQLEDDDLASLANGLQALVAVASGKSRPKSD
jgi:DNA-binding MarR family transcriptional regulator